MENERAVDGRCMCGAVAVSAIVKNPILRACHCDMCRRQTSSMFMSLAIVSGSLKVEGPAKSFRSSDWAERGFCTECGSTLWYGTLHNGERHPAAGLFENAAGAPIKLEFYSDMAPEAYALSGNHRKMTAMETERLFQSNDGAES
ncbi:MAG: GFA family protein [Roseovarius sp.]|nr:GFA family protein [Roseovarius sp.]MCY4314637.1 GFA family protein [Roseovarius sp.]